MNELSSILSTSLLAILIGVLAYCAILQHRIKALDRMLHTYEKLLNQRMFFGGYDGSKVKGHHGTHSHEKKEWK